MLVNILWRDVEQACDKSSRRGTSLSKAFVWSYRVCKGHKRVTMNTLKLFNSRAMKI